MVQIGQLPKFDHIRLPEWQHSGPSRELVEARFAPDYSSARERFLELAGAAGAQIHSYPIHGTGAAGEKLSIDIAELAGRTSLQDAKGVLVVISGVHGSEGRVGSAIQQQLLATRESIPSNCAVVLVHALNPHGMSHERRNTESNVDLNRNFTLTHSGAPEHYHEVRKILSPENVAELERSMAYFESLPATELKRLLQMLAPGQYEFERDPFFGGRAIEPNVRIVQEHLRSRLGTNSNLLFLDIHTGLGAGGEDTLFYLGENRELQQRLTRSLEPRHMLRDPRVTIPFFNKVHGSVAGGFAREFADVNASSFVLEIGTYPNVLLGSQTLEGYCAKFPDSSLQQTARDLSRESFCPDNAQWRAGVLQRGTDIVTRSIDAL